MALPNSKSMNFKKLEVECEELTATSMAVTTVTSTNVTATNVTGTNVIIGVGGSFDSDSGTATAVAGAATLSKMAGVITSEALTTAAQAAYTLTLTNTTVAAADIVMVSAANGTNTQGIPIVGRVTPGAGSCVILIENQHATQAFNGTIKISFLVVKA